MYVYLTAEDGITPHIGLEAIDRKLSRLPLGQTIELLAQIAFEADASIGDRSRQSRLLHELLPHDSAMRAERKLQDPRVVPLPSQVVLALAVRALALPRSSAPAMFPSMDRLAHAIGPLLFGLATHTTANDGTDEGLILELARLDLYYRIQDMGAWWDVARELFFQILPSMTDHPQYIDIHTAFQEVNNISLLEYWSLCVAFGAARMTSREDIYFPQELGAGSLPLSVQERWLSMLTAPLENIRALAQTDLTDNRNWSFASLMSYPLIPIDGGRSIVLRPAFLGRKAAPAGLFWAVRNAVVKLGVTHSRWSNLFGAACERLGRGWVAQAFSGARFEEDIDLSRKAPGEKTCDVLFREGRNLVAIDFVYRQMTKATLATGGYKDLVRDVGLAATSKLEQIDSTLLRERLENVDRVYPVIVVGAPFPSQAPILNMVDEWADSNASFVGRDTRSAPPAIMDLAEFAILLKGPAHGWGVTDLLSAWLSSDMVGTSFRNWCTTDGPRIGTSTFEGAPPLVRDTLFPNRSTD